MGRRILWTKEQIARAFTMHEEGKSPYAIGLALDYDLKSVRAMFARHGVVIPSAPLFSPWSDEETAILKAGCAEGRGWAAISADLKAAGYDRTPEASQNKAAKLKLMGLRPKASSSEKSKACASGWPRMVGDEEERDARYVRLLLEEQLRMVRAAKVAA